jgi:hypothetical protein
MKLLRPLLKVVGVLCALVVVVLAGAIALAVYTGELAGPISWRFPQGYRGWVIVQYENANCPPLNKDGIYLATPISASGRGCTSSPMPQGWRYNRYEYVNTDGTRTKLRADGWNTNSMIWPLSADLENKKEFLFVGTQEELNRSWGSRPDSGRRD